LHSDLDLVVLVYSIVISGVVVVTYSRSTLCSLVIINHYLHPLLTYANDQGAHVLIKNKNVGQLSSSLELENLELSNKAELAAPSDHLKLLTNKEFHQ
jgi:hypothetical protein